MIDLRTTVGAFFTARSDTSQIDVGLGERRFTVAESDRNSFVPLEYLQIESVANPANSMIAQTVALDRDIGALDVDVIVVERQRHIQQIGRSRSPRRPISCTPRHRQSAPDHGSAGRRLYHGTDQ